MKDGKGWKRMEKGCPFGQNLIAPSLRFIQETGGVKRNPKFMMSWKQWNECNGEAPGLFIDLGSWRPRVRKNKFTWTLIAQLQHIFHCSLGTTHHHCMKKQLTIKNKIICGTLGRVKRSIKPLGDRSSNPLTYGYSSSDSFGYDRDYEPRHVIGIAWGFEMCFFDLLWTCPKARLGLHFFASYLGCVSLNFTIFCRACVNLSQSLSDCQESNFSNSCRSCNWGLQLWLRRPKLR